jgi:hypothetical protein
MYGDMQNVSAQIIENMHLKVKDAAARSNGQDGWELQAMVRNMRESALQLKTWTPPHSRTVTDFVTDVDVAGNGHGEGDGGAPSTLGVSTSSANMSVARTGANATFRNGAALRYPVWKVILDYAKCSRHLEVPTVRKLERSNLVVQVNSLCGPNSEWLKLCADLQHLPRFLAKYTCARFHASHPHLVPNPVGLLSHQEITELVNMVQVVAPRNNHRSAGKQRPGTIAPFNVLAIRHPAVAGQVLHCPVSKSRVSDSMQLLEG